MVKLVALLLVLGVPAIGRAAELPPRALRRR